jgi:hypothetical protein
MELDGAVGVIVVIMVMVVVVMMIVHMRVTLMVVRMHMRRTRAGLACRVAPHEWRGDLFRRFSIDFCRPRLAASAFLAHALSTSLDEAQHDYT